MTEDQIKMLEAENVFLKAQNKRLTEQIKDLQEANQDLKYQLLERQNHGSKDQSRQSRCRTRRR